MRLLELCRWWSFFFGSMLDFDLYGYHYRCVLMELDG